MPHLNIIWNPNKFQILGVWLSTNLKESEFLNYDEKTIKVIFLFKIRKGSLGRVAVLKSLILSKLVHLWMLLPNPLDDFVNKLY